LRSAVTRLAQNAAGRFGYRIVRWPEFLGNDSDVRTRERFFPVGRHEPWTTPAALAARQEPWARELVDIYSDRSCWPGSIAPEAGWLLHLLVLNIGPRTVVETGTFMGVSTIWMAGALRELEATRGVKGSPALHAFDLFGINPDDPAGSASFAEQRLAEVTSRFTAAGVDDLIEIHQGSSPVEIARSSDRLRQGVEFAFIDGDHTLEGVVADLRAVEPFLPVGGYVVLHDTFPEVCSQPGPRMLIDGLDRLSTYRYQVCELYTAQTNYGLAVMRRVA
jgi:predicted O-methyltransferase YrrM